MVLDIIIIYYIIFKILFCIFYMHRKQHVNTVTYLKNYQVPNRIRTSLATLFFMVFST